MAYALALGPMACDGTPPEESQVVDVAHEDAIGMSWEEYRRQATLRINGQVIYRLSGDEFTASEEDLRAEYGAIYGGDEDRPKLHVYKQLSTGFEPTYPVSTRTSIRYCISNQFGTYPPSKATMVANVQTATQAWEKLAGVRFRYDSGWDGNCTDQTTGVEFAVVPSTTSYYSGCGANKLMWGSPPTGPLCPVNGPFNSAGTKGVLAINLPKMASYQTLHGLLLHELGHILGFRHEHPFGPNGCGQSGPFPEPQVYTPGDVAFRALTLYDQPSVMHYSGMCGKLPVDYTLSWLDGIGSRAVYGIPASWNVPIQL